MLSMKGGRIDASIDPRYDDNKKENSQEIQYIDINEVKVKGNQQEA